LLRIAGDGMAYALEATSSTVTEIIRHGRKLRPGSGERKRLERVASGGPPSLDPFANHPKLELPWMVGFT
jgi:hypothetical protein